MEQRTRWSAGHARVAVGRARRHTLEQNGHGAHTGLAVECVDEMDLARPRIGETEIDARFHECAEQAFRTVQRNLLLFRSFATTSLEVARVPCLRRGAIAE